MTVQHSYRQMRFALGILCCLINFFGIIPVAGAQETSTAQSAEQALPDKLETGDKSETGDKPETVQPDATSPPPQSATADPTAPENRPATPENTQDAKVVYASYIHQIKTRIEEALAAQPDLAHAEYRFVAHIWIAQDGRVERAELQDSSGVAAIDELIAKALASMQPIAGLLPPGMPQPVKLRITSKNAAEEIDEQKVVRVQYIPEFLKQQLREEIKQAVLAQAQAEGWAAPGILPGWLERISLDGDIRLRYELDSYPYNYPLDNAPPYVFKGGVLRNVNSVDNTTDNRSRFRIRARLGANAKVNEWLAAGIRMTTGSASDPVSANQTLNSKDSKFSFTLDRAFLKAQASSTTAFTGGRFANPWFSTDLVWDPDFAFDGLAAHFNSGLSDRWSTFGTLGIFALEEVQSSDTNRAKDKWMWGMQAGVEWESAAQSSVRVGAALYDFKNVEGRTNTLIPGDTTYDGTVPAFRQKGNNTFDIYKGGVTSCGTGTNNSGCGLASKFREINLTAQVDWAIFAPVHVILSGDYVKNIGFDANEIFLRTGNSYEEETKGHQLKLTVGMTDTAKKGDWQVFAGQKRLEADAVLDAYTDSDFHLGGTDTKGWFIGTHYGLGKNTWLGLRWMSTNEITGLPLAIDILMLDLNAKF